MEVEMNKEKKMSEFCEALMDATGKLGDLRQESDCAILLCSDGNTLANRISGNMVQAFNLLLKEMLVDDNFAEVIMEACHAYSMTTLQHQRAMNSYLEKADRNEQQEILDFK